MALLLRGSLYLKQELLLMMHASDFKAFLKGTMAMNQRPRITKSSSSRPFADLDGIRPPAGSRDPAWLALRCALWPDAKEDEHLRDLADVLARGHFVRLAFDPKGVAVGFVEASKRSDYVNGTNSSPVAFVEGLYVEPGARRKGFARALVACVERWAAAEGCAELASDSPIGNVAAHAVHRSLGFEETERVVYFRRYLDRA